MKNVSNKTHGNTGNSNASKTDDQKLETEPRTFALPKGWHATLKRHCHPGKVSPWIREAIKAKAEAEGLKLT